MTTSSWVFAKSGSGASVTGIGTVAWTGATDVNADDSTRASANTIPAGGASNWLRAYFDFATGDVVPAGATIVGIEAEVDCFGYGGYPVRFNAARLVIGGTIQGSNVDNMPATNWGTPSTGDAPLTLGGATNLWGATPSAADVRGSTFGIAISAKNDEASKNRNAGVDYIRMRIYYTVASGDVWLPILLGSGSTGELEMGRQIKKGSTDQSIDIFIGDTSTGAGKTGLAYNTSGLSMWYHRTGAAKTSITLATLSALTDAHSDGGFKEIGDGHYRLDVPDAAFATGVNEVRFGGAATGGVVIPTSNHLVDYDPQDTVRLGLTAMPNVASGNAGALLVDGTGTAAISTTGGRAKSDVSYWNAAAVAAPDTAGYPKITIKNGTGTGELSLTSGLPTGMATLAKLLKYVQLLVRKDSAIATDNATELTEINADGGSGAGAFANTTDGLEAIRDRGDAAWTTGGGGSGDWTSDEKTAIRTILGIPASGTTPDAPSSGVLSIIRDRIGAFTGSGVNTVLGFFKSLLSKTASTPSDVGGTFDPATDSTEAIRDRGDAAWTTGSAAPSAGTVAAAVFDLATSGHTTSGTFGEAIVNSATNSAAIKAKTDNLPSDPADASDISDAFSTVNSTLSTIAGYIDTEIAAIKAKTDNLPSDPADASVISDAFTKIRKYLQLIARKDSAITTDNATELTELNANGGSGAGSYNNTTDSLEARAEAGYCCQFGINAKSTEGKVLQLEAWLEADGQFVDLSSVDPAATVSITLSEHGSGVVQVTAGSGEVPNAAGRFEFEYDMEAEDAGYPNLVDDRGYTAIVEITANSVTYTTVHSFAAIGGE